MTWSVEPKSASLRTFREFQRGWKFRNSVQFDALKTPKSSNATSLAIVCKYVSQFGPVPILRILMSLGRSSSSNLASFTIVFVIWTHSRHSNVRSKRTEPLEDRVFCHDPIVSRAFSMGYYRIQTCHRPSNYATFPWLRIVRTFRPLRDVADCSLV